jgi:hypothetical protein
MVGDVKGLAALLGTLTCAPNVAVETNNDCGTANGACAKAWQELTGESGAIDTGLIAGNVSGAAGAWNNLGNVPFHLRESRAAADGQQTSTNYFYCSGFANKDAAGNSTNCSGSGSLNIATGKSLSRHTHSADQLLWNSGAYPLNAVGMFSSGGWATQGCDHWLDFAYTPYLLTGRYYFLEEEYFSASYCLGHINPFRGRHTAIISSRM